MPRGGIVDGYFIVAAGRSGATRIYGDTWRSRNGVDWECTSSAAGWGRRAYPEIDVVGSSLVLTGGQSLTKFHNDVWRSDDHGRSWYQVCDDAPWSARAGHHSLVVDDEILLFAGGYRSWRRVFFADLWASSDAGETWTKRAELPTDMGRAGMQVVEVGGTLFFMGGDHDRPVFQPNWEGRRNDIWASTDRGASWELIGHAPWQPRTGHQCVAHDEHVICIGGHIEGSGRFTQALAHDMWVWNPLRDADDWQLVTDDVWGVKTGQSATGKSDFLLEVRDGKLWTFGGDREVLSPWPQDNDVWTGTLPAEW